VKKQVRYTIKKMIKIYIWLFHNLSDVRINKQINIGRLVDNWLNMSIVQLKNKYKYKIKFVHV
jgi:hypothetical protein